MFEVSQFDLLKTLERARELITMCDENTMLKWRKVRDMLSPADLDDLLNIFNDKRVANLYDKLLKTDLVTYDEMSTLLLNSSSLISDSRLINNQQALDVARHSNLKTLVPISTFILVTQLVPMYFDNIRRCFTKIDETLDLFLEEK